MEVENNSKNEIQPPGIILAPWKNPLVQTAFMLKAKRGGLVSMVIIYIGLLAVAGFGWMYWCSLQPAQANQVPGLKVYFLFVLIAQTCFSALIGMIQTAASMKSEVMQKTLDFQRMAGVDPWTILLGKILGPPTMAYMLAISAFPVAVFCIINGIAGVGLLELLLLWLAIFTTTILFASIFVQYSIHKTNDKNTAGGVVIGFMIFFFQFLFGSIFGGGMLEILQHPLKAFLPGAFTPVLSWIGTGYGDPWRGKLYLFNEGIPTLLITPVLQLLLSWLLISFMVRKFRNSQFAAMGKATALAVLLIGAVLIIGTCASLGMDGPLGAAGWSVPQIMLAFCAIFSFFATIVFVLSTPRKELLWSWVWQDAPRSKLSDWMWSDRSPSIFIVIFATVLGISGALVLSLLTSGNGFEKSAIMILLVMAVSVFTWGWVMQMLNLAGGKYGMLGFLFYSLGFVLVPFVAAMILKAQNADEVLCSLIGSISPVYLYVSETVPIGGRITVAYWPVFMVFHALMFAIAFYFIFKRLRQMKAAVEKKKAMMLAQ